MRRPLFILGAVLVACNAISGLDEDFVLVPFDGGALADATTGDDGAPTNDGSPTNDVVSSDAPTDASAGDAFACDAGDVANVVFCADFESDASWESTELSEGTVAFELDAGVGGTIGMHAHAKDAGGISRRAALWKRISGNDAETYAHYDVEFDFMVAGKTFPYAALGIFGLTQPADGGGLRYYGPAAFGDRMLEEIDDPPDFEPNKDGVTDNYGTWHHTIMTLDREDAGTYSLALKIDAKTVDARSGFSFGNPQTAEVRIGILFTSLASGTMDLFVDNVVVRRVK